MSRIGIRIAAIAALLIAASCTETFRNHGFVPRADTLAEVRIGQDTRETVAEKIGQPASDGLRRQDAWYYVESRFRIVPFAGPREIERRVLRILFSPGGRVAAIEEFGLQDGRVVRLNANVTETIESDTGFIRQLLGAAGNVDPSALLN